VDNLTGTTVPAQYESRDSLAPNPQSGDYKENQPTGTDFPQGNVYQKPVPTGSFTSLAAENQLNERNLFLQFDGFGNLTNQSQAYLASDGAGGYHFAGAYQNTFQFDALGRRVTESAVNRNSASETTELYYDASGNVIQDSDRATGGVDNQYVWCPVQSGMMILRDSKNSGETNSWGVAASGLNLRMWAMQGPDGSMWQIVGDSTSSSTAFREQVVYDPNGQDTAITFATDGLASLFNTTTHYDWRYLWKGGRAGRDQISSDGSLSDPTYIDVYDGTYLIPNGVVYDTHNSVSAPLQSDKYAFFRTTAANGGLNQNQYGTRSFVNATFGSNGTGSNMQDLKAQLAMVQLQSGFEEMFTFGTSAVSNVYNSVVGGVKEMGLRIADYYNTALYVASTYATDGRYSLGYNGSFSQFGQAIDTHRTSRWSATLSAIPVAGAAYQAYSGQDLLTGQRLSGVDRVAMGFSALGDAAFFSAGGLEVADRFGLLNTAEAAISGRLPKAPRQMPLPLLEEGEFQAASDLLKDRLGSAMESHPEEHASIMKDLGETGVEVTPDPNRLAYTPGNGGPGQMILDPNASIGALRHEYQHFLDDRAAGYPGMRYWFEDPANVVGIEERGYAREIQTAIETGNGDLVPLIQKQLQDRVSQLLGG
jgi:hypothetical protein